MLICVTRRVIGARRALVIAAYGLLLPAAFAQVPSPERKKVEKADDLPRHTYALSESPSALLNDPAAFNRLATMAYKLRQSSGGTLDFQQLRNATANGGMYIQNMSAEGWAMAEPQIQEMTGGRYATAKTTAGVRMSGALSAPPKNLIAEMERLGLWTKDRQALSAEDSALFNETMEKFMIQRVCLPRIGLALSARIAFARTTFWAAVPARV